MAKNSLSFEQLESLLAELESIAGTSKGITVAAELEERARALEYGSVVGQRPWPQPGDRTVLAIDPESGARVVVSAQAPQGFIRLHIHEFLEQLTGSLRQPADWLDAKIIQGHIAQATQFAAERGLETMRSAAPRDSGELAASLHIIE